MQALAAAVLLGATGVWGLQLAPGAFAPVEAYKKRPSCGTVIAHTFGWNMDSTLAQFPFFILASMPLERKRVVNEQHGLEKAVLYALDSAAAWQYQDVAASQLKDLATCEVDPVNGRSLAMKLTELGLHRALEHKFVRQQLFSPDGMRDVDKAGHNLLHMAALSESEQTFNVVVRALQGRAGLSPVDLIEMLEEENEEKQRPVDLAVMPSLRRRIVSYYSTLKMLRGLAGE